MFGGVSDIDFRLADQLASLTGGDMLIEKHHKKDSNVKNALHAVLLCVYTFEKLFTFMSNFRFLLCFFVAYNLRRNVYSFDFFFDN